MSETGVIKIGDVDFDRDNDRAYWSALLQRGRELPSPANLGDDAARLIPELFDQILPALGMEVRAFAHDNGNWVHKIAAVGDQVVFWDGQTLGAVVYPGAPQAWSRERLAFAKEVNAAATELGADCLIDLGSGPGVMGLYLALVNRLPLLNLDASEDALRFAEIVKARHGLPWTNVRVDMVRAVDSPSDLKALGALIPGKRPLLLTRTALQYYTNAQLRRIFDWFLSVGVIGGIHYEGEGARTPTFAKLWESVDLTKNPVALPPDPERDPFGVLSSHPDMEIFRRQEIAPHFMTREWWSVLGWKRRTKGQMSMTLDELAAGLRSKFGYDLDGRDLQDALDQGILVISDTKPAVPRGEIGLGVIGVGYLSLSREFTWKYSGYQVQRDEIAALSGSDRSLAKVLSILDAHVANNPKVARHCEPRGLLYGREMVTIPYMGLPTLIRREMLPSLYRLIVAQALASHITPETDAVIEFGSGVGDVIAELADHHHGDQIQFIATDVARGSVGCVKAIAQICELTNLTAKELDLSRPDLGFVRAFRRPLFFCREALFMLDDGPGVLFDALAQLPGARLVAFEPLGRLPTEREPIHVVSFTAEAAERARANHDLWRSIEDAIRDGKLIVDDLLPDLIGKNIDIPASMIVMRVPG